MGTPLFFEATPPRFLRAVSKLAHADEGGKSSAGFLRPARHEGDEAPRGCVGRCGGRRPDLAVGGFACLCFCGGIVQLGDVGWIYRQRLHYIALHVIVQSSVPRVEMEAAWASGTGG